MVLFLFKVYYLSLPLYLAFCNSFLVGLVAIQIFYVYLYDVNLDRLKYEWQDLPYRYTEL